MSVLIVCGDTSAKGLLAQLLGADGHEVVAAPSGQRALDVLKCNPNIKVVVADRLIPDMSPFDLFRAYNAYREMQWPGCETARGTPAFVLSHPLKSHAEIGREVLDAVSGNDSRRIPSTPDQVDYEPSVSMR